MTDLSSPAPPQLPRHKLSVEDFHRLGPAGVLDEDSRVELLRGDLIDMAPIGSMHAGVVAQLNLLLSRGVQDGLVQVQNPVTIGDESELQPDLCVLRHRTDFYKHALPSAADVLLLIEVADTTLGYDRGHKIPLYAQAGIPEVWLVNIPERLVEVFTRPGPAGYGQISIRRGGDTLSSDRVLGVTVDIAGLF
jgi:Uma2 family endonuclease